ncbi:MAG: hypothetical protein K8R21_08015 [Leptospira sp.]|nr:hypothetical protein [Leptospira sp.]
MNQHLKNPGFKDGNLPKKISLYILTAVQLVLIIYSLLNLYEKFDSLCPNKEFITWDPSLRFITTLQMMDNIRQFRIGQFFFQILDSPTWPVLRNLIQVAVFFITEPSQIIDIRITFATFIVLILVSGLLIYSEERRKSAYLNLILIFIGWNLILHSPVLLVYGFSGMLEIQGAVFFLLSVYFTANFYLKNDFLTKFSNRIFFLLSVTGLFHSKYPYGYLYIFSLVIFEAFTSPQVFYSYVIRYFSYFRNAARKNPRLFVILILGVSLFLPESLLYGKSKKYIRYVIVLLMVLDFFIYFLKQKKELTKLGFEKLNFLVGWIFLPVIGWVLIHPDRFSSSGSTISHVQSEGHAIGEAVSAFDYYMVFFREMILNSFSDPVTSGALFIILCISFCGGLILFLRKKELSRHFIYSFFIMLSVLILTFLTPNHQARHIYHLYPAIVMVALCFISYIFYEKSKLAAIAILLFFGILCGSFFVNFNRSLDKTTLCFSGTDRSAYALPLWAAPKTGENLSGNTIFINDIDPEYVNRADSELLLNIQAYNRHIKIMTNPKKFRSIEGYSELIFLSNSCKQNSELLKFQQIFGQQVKLNPGKEIISELGCIRFYGLQR